MMVAVYCWKIGRRGSMKVIKALIAVFLAVIFGFITTYILSYINVNYTGEFLPIPHFIPGEKLPFYLGLIFIIAIYLLIFSYLVRKKYFNFGISIFGMIVAVLKYKKVSSTFLPVNMGFVSGLLELGKILCFFMAIGIIAQWIVDGGISAIKYANKNGK